ncbi:uncharacterized protein A1O5_02095 [Cladophialophora psammophila CBS 110553]|uniref:Uncharacterized protein n=1 Tax=Cladophialophora psammophila CBS 110553 TaxID=1182543 RepID=W9XYQ8_9EURO|nr:uncharacterized protein A1O5_02095 [Cladophialophora psammophila CBS 110553]EXJ75399.1 hypothetical protein A1O5_02095 [Cladophialophora psammophila CBS 110553]
MSESCVTTICFRKTQDFVPEPTSSSLTFLDKSDPLHGCTKSDSGEPPLKRIDSGFFEGICQAEESAESAPLAKDDESCRPLSSTPKPRIDHCIIPKRLRHAIRQDLCDPRALFHSVRHGYLHTDVRYDKQIAALCSHAAGSSQNMEVVKYTRAFPNDVSTEPRFKTSQLYGHGASDIEAYLYHWATERAAMHQRQARTNVGRMKEKQSQVEGGLIAGLRKRIDRPAGYPGILHCRVNKPARPEKTLLSSYSDAFRAWDTAMSQSIPGYAGDYEKRHWYISQWDGPSAK